MKITITCKITGNILAEDENIKTLKHDKEKNELLVNDYKTLKNASDYEVKIEL